MPRIAHVDGRGQSGVATLVVFVALVLVSATAAGATIGSANALDITAVATGTDSVTQLSERVGPLGTTGRTTETTVVTAFTVEISENQSVDSDGETRRISVGAIDLTGTDLTNYTTTVGGDVAIDTDEINATASNVTALEGDRVDATVLGTDERSARTVDTLNLHLKPAPGAGPIDLEDTTVEYASARKHGTLTHGERANRTRFSTTTVVGDGTVPDESGDRVDLSIDAAAVRGERIIENDGGELRLTYDSIGLEASETLAIGIVTASGGTAEYHVTVPNVLHTSVVTL